jgi:hypothetical protein
MRNIHAKIYERYRVDLDVTVTHSHIHTQRVRAAERDDIIGLFFL